MRPSLLVALLVAGLASAQPYRLGDLNTHGASSQVTALSTFANNAFFSANDPLLGTEPYFATNTTATLVTDFEPGPFGSGFLVSQALTPNLALFAGQSGLYSFDRTSPAPGQVLLWASSLRPLVTLTNGVTGAGLWVSGLSQPFSVWRSDGTFIGTSEVAAAATFTTVGGGERFLSNPTTGVFTANSDELWTTSGVQLRDFSVAPALAYPTGLVAGNTLIYFATSGTTTTGVWRTDGTSAGTFVLTAAANGSLEAATSGDVLYFAAPSANGNELWRSDGTVAGTALLADLNVGAASSNPRNFQTVATEVYFVATTATVTNALYRTNGAAAPVFVLDLGAVSYAVSPSRVPGSRYLTFIDTGTAYELRSVLTGASTSTTLGTFERSVLPVVVGGLAGTGVFFVAPQATVGTELWFTDGTAAGTVTVRDLSPGTASSNPRSFLATPTGELAYFSTDQGVYVTDGGAALKLASRPPSNTVPQSQVLGALGSTAIILDSTPATGLEPYAVSAAQASTLLREVSDGGPSGTFQYGVRLGSNIYFAATPSNVNNWSLWTSDGTPQGTVSVVDVEPSVTGSLFGLAALGNRLYFTAFTSTHGFEPWVSDGTAAGTHEIADLVPGPNSSAPSVFVAFRGGATFSTSQGTWFTDGTAGGTTLLSSLSSFDRCSLLGDDTLFIVSNGRLARSRGPGSPMVPLAPSLSVSNLACVGDLALFSDATGGLWSIDAVASSPVRVTGGLGGSTEFYAAGSVLYFGADQNAGVELWKYDGTAHAVADLAPGLLSSSPRQFARLNDRLLFAASNDGIDFEPWALAIDGTPPSITTSVTGTQGNNGWYISDVNVTFTVVETGSRLVTHGCTPAPLTTDTTGLTLRCLALSEGLLAESIVTLKRDTSAPTAPVITTPTANATVGRRPTVSGTIAEPGTVELRLGTTLLGTATVVSAGPFAVSASTDVADGPQTLSVTLVDDAGNRSLATSLALQVDATAPAAPVVLRPAQGGASNDSVFSGTAEPGSTVAVSVDGGPSPVCVAVVDVAGAWGCSAATPLTQGPHALSATATDVAGNTSVSTGHAFVVDTTAPGAPSIVAPGPNQVLAMTRPSISGHADVGTTVQVVFDLDVTKLCTAVATTTGDWSCLAPQQLVNGGHRVQATATDAAGNVSSPSPLVSFSIDATVPGAPTLTTPASGTLLSTPRPTFQGTATSGALLRVVVDDAATPVCTVLLAGTGWQCAPSVALGQGAHHAVAITSNTLGSDSAPSAGIDFVLDSVAPDAPTVTRPAANSIVSLHPTFELTAEASSVVTVRLDGQRAALCTATADATGVASCTPPMDLSEGPHAAVATATDVAGNTSEPSGALVFTASSALDTRAPELTCPPDITIAASSGSSSSVNFTATVTDNTDLSPTLHYSQPPGSDFLVGATAVTVTATDAASNTSSCSFKVTVTGSTGTAARGCSAGGPDVLLVLGALTLLLRRKRGVPSMTRAGAALALMLSTVVHAQPYLLGNLNTRGGGSRPTALSVFGSTAFFGATTAPLGAEPYWATPASGALLTDFTAGVVGSNFSMSQALSANVAVFSEGYRLVGFDRTQPTPGVVLFTDVSRPLLSLTTGIGFWAEGNYGNQRVVRTDGTLANTTVLASFTSVGEGVRFGAGTSGVFIGNANELWSTSGSALRSFSLSLEAGPHELVAGTSVAWFLLSDQTLWRTDGTGPGTIQLRGPTGVSTLEGAASGNVLLFAAGTTSGGVELWRSDGTTVGTSLLIDLNPGSVSSNPRSFQLVGTDVYFVATTPTGSDMLYKSNGTAAGTVVVRNLNAPLAIVQVPRAPTGHPLYAVKYGNAWFLLTINGVSTVVLGIYGPTTPVMVVDETVATNVFYTVDDPTTGLELWVTDGNTTTLTGTHVALDVQPGSAPSNPRQFIASATGTLGFFSTDLGLFVTDGGTPTALTTPNAAVALPAGQLLGLTSNGAIAISSATDGGNELFLGVPGQPQRALVELTPGDPGTTFTGSATLGSDVIFGATTGGLNAVWKTDGTIAGTVLLTSSQGPATDFTTIGGRTWFSASGAHGIEPWVTDGTAGGTFELFDVVSGAASSAPSNFTPWKNGVLFDTQVSGLWFTDGTAAGTVQASSLPPRTHCALLGDTAIFLVATDGHLYRLAGVGAAPVQVAPTQTLSSVTCLGDRALFFPFVGGSGPFVIDASSATSTALTLPAAYASRGEVFATGTTAWLTLQLQGAPSPGLELYKYDGVSVSLVADLAPGALSSTPANFGRINNRLLFSAASDGFDVEPWATALDGTAPLITPTVTGTLGTNGWYTSNVAVSFVVAEPDSRVVTNGCSAQTVSTDTTSLTIRCQALSEGGKSEASVTLKRDTTPPTAPTIVAPAAAASVGALPRVSGTVSEPGTIELRQGSVLLCRSTVNQAGTFTCDSTVALQAGSATLSVTLIDPAGLTSAARTVTVTIDTVAPAAPLITEPASASGVPTSRLTGTTEAGASVVVTLDANSTAACSTTADGTGAWTCTPSAVADGAHVAHVTATDVAGNASSASTVAFTLDTTAPQAPTLTSPTSGERFANGAVEIGGLAEPLSQLTVTFDGSGTCTTQTGAQGTWSCAASTALTDGAHRVVAIATDAAGNASQPSAEVLFSIDSSVPATPTLDAPTAGSLLSTSTPLFSGTAPAGALVRVVVDAAAAASCTAIALQTGSWHCTPTAELAQGMHTAVAVALNELGTPSQPSSSLAFAVDSIAPDAPEVTRPAGSAHSLPGVQFEGTAEPTSTVRLMVDGQVTPTCTATTSDAGTFACTATSPLTLGEHTLEATAVDLAGNSSAPSGSRVFTVSAVIDVRPPELSCPADQTLEAGRTGIATADFSATVTDDVDATPSLHYSNAPGSAFAIGETIVTVKATDASNNTSSCSFHVTVTARALPASGCGCSEGVGPELGLLSLGLALLLRRRRVTTSTPPGARWPALVLALSSLVATAQPYQLADLNTRAGGSSIGRPSVLSSTASFTATTLASGSEPWSNAPTTSQMLDVSFGAPSSGFIDVQTLGSTHSLFSTGTQLFNVTRTNSTLVYDGATQGQQLRPLVTLSNAGLTIVGGLWAVTGPTFGFTSSVIRSDGTVAGTTLVKSSLVSIGGAARFQSLPTTGVFAADNALYTATGALLGQFTAQPQDLTPGASLIYFTVGGQALGATNGATSSIVLGDVQVPRFQGATIANRLVFAAGDSTNGVELWASQGTGPTTSLVTDLLPGSGGSNPRFFQSVGTAAYFVATTATTQNMLFRTDGTALGTVAVADLGVVADVIAPDVSFVGRPLYFVDNGSNWVLMTHTGVSLLPLQTCDRAYRPLLASSAAAVANFYVADAAPAGRQLWSTNGAAVTQVTTLSAATASSNPRAFRTNAAGNRAFFTTDLGVASTNGLTATAGTPNVPLSLVSNQVLGVLDTTAVISNRGSAPIGTEVYLATPGQAATLLADVQLGAPNTDFTGGARVGPNVIFGVSSLGTLWRSDGTVLGTLEVIDPEPAAVGSISDVSAAAGKGWFSASTLAHGEEPWVSDGSLLGTHELKDLNPGSASSSPSGFMPFKKGVIFSTKAPVATWFSDGTAQGTVQFSTHQLASGCTLLGDETAFFTDEAGSLFRTTGPGGATTQLTGPGTVTLRCMGDRAVYFVRDARGQYSGSWVAEASSLPFANPVAFVPEAFAAGSVLYLSNSQPLSASTSIGAELYKYDGAALAQVRDIVVGAGGSNPHEFGRTSDRLLFAAATNGIDVEPWALAIDGTPPVITPVVTGTAGTNGWYTSDVNVSFVVTEPNSRVVTRNCTAQVITTDTTGQTLTCLALSEGGPSSATVVIKRDTVAPAAPVVTSPLDNGSVGLRPTVRGTVAEAGTLEVRIGSTIVCTTSVIAAGTWACPVTVDLLQGATTLVVTERDDAGNVSPPASVTVTLDTVPPASAAISTPTAGASVQAPTFSGTGEAGAAVSVTIDGSATLCTALIDANGHWQCAAAIAGLTEGTHLASVIVTDPAGNAAPASTEGFTVDTTAPLAPVITTPTGGARVTTATPQLAGSAEVSSTVTVTLDDDPSRTCTGASTASGWSCTPSTPLADGLHVAAAVAVDAAGNTSPVSARVGFTVDATVPAAPTITRPAAGATLTTTRPPFEGTALAGQTVRVLVDGALTPVCTMLVAGAGAWQCAPSVGLAEGAHTAVAIASNARGADSPESMPRPFTIDSSAPAAPVLTRPAGGSTVSPLPSFEGTAEAGSTVELRLDGQPTAVCSAITSGTSFTCTPASPLRTGAHSATAYAFDGVGNRSRPSGSVLFTVATTADGQPPTISCPPDLTVEADRGGSGHVSFSATATDDVDPAPLITYAPAPGSDLPEGETVVTATATDASQNTASCSFRVKVTPSTQTGKVKQGCGCGSGPDLLLFGLAALLMRRRLNVPNRGAAAPVLRGA